VCIFFVLPYLVVQCNCTCPEHYEDIISCCLRTIHNCNVLSVWLIRAVVQAIRQSRSALHDKAIFTLYVQYSLYVVKTVLVREEH
jgi:lipase chaperone LimK